MQKLSKGKLGFTLVELLIVIGILGILLAIVLVALNPARQFAQANNVERRNDVNTLLNAIHQYAADNAGALPTGITGVVQNISTAGADICADVSTQYVALLPVDPTVTTGDVSDCAAAYDTGYTVVQSATDNRVTVAAPSAELSEAITVTR